MIKLLIKKGQNDRVVLVSLILNPSSKLSLSWRLRKPWISWNCCFVVSNHKSTSSRQPRRVKFHMQVYFNPTKRNLKKKKMGSPDLTLLPPPLTALNRVNKCKLSSRQPRRLKFDMQAYFNPTKRNLKKKLTPTSPTLTLNRANKCNLSFGQPRKLKFNNQLTSNQLKPLNLME